MAILAQLWHNSSLRGVAAVFAFKGTSTVLNFTLVTLAARLMTEADFGTYSVLFSAVGLLGIVACLGQQMLLMRSWSEYLAADDPAHLKGALRFGAAALALGCLATATIFYLWLSSRYPLALTLATLAYVVTIAIVLTTMHLVRTAIGVGSGDGLGNILVVTGPILYLVACLVTGTKADLTTIFVSFPLLIGVAIVVHLVLLWRRLRRLYPDLGRIPARYDLAAWQPRSLKLWVSNSLEASNQYLDVLVLAYLMSPAMAGAYFVITRLANVFASATDALHMYATRYIPDLYYRGDRARLGRLLHVVALLTLIIVVGGMTVVALSGHMVLGLFNADYTAYFPALLVLCIGTASLAAVGPASFILMFTGHEGAYLRIIGTSVALRALAFFVLVPYFGIMGAAAATAASLIVMAILLRYYTQSMSGIDSSVVNLLRRDEKLVPVR